QPTCRASLQTWTSWRRSTNLSPLYKHGPPGGSQPICRASTNMDLLAEVNQSVAPLYKHGPPGGGQPIRRASLQTWTSWRRSTKPVAPTTNTDLLMEAHKTFILNNKPRCCNLIY